MESKNSGGSCKESSLTSIGIMAAVVVVMGSVVAPVVVAVIVVVSWMVPGMASDLLRERKVVSMGAVGRQVSVQASDPFDPSQSGAAGSAGPLSTIADSLATTVGLTVDISTVVG